MTTAALPILSDAGLASYMNQVHKFPMLTAEDEYIKAKALIEHNDIKAAHTLVTSHLRLVVKTAMGFRGYGLPVTDLIAEGNIGLMQAVKRFDPERGFRLSTYALWWIRAAINEYILKSWSLVKMGTSAAHKKLFFNLRKIKKRLLSLDDSPSTDRQLYPEEITTIANELNVSEREVTEMNERMFANDSSLNVSVNDESDTQLIDYLEDTSANQEMILSKSQILEQKRELLKKAMQSLNERERDIICERRMSEKPSTLEKLSQKYGISRERIRQIESRAIMKLTTYSKSFISQQSLE